MPTRIKLPKTPIVIARNKSVIVQFLNGAELRWGDEETHEEAKKISKELEIELRAVKYVQDHVHNFIKDMREHLTSLGIDSRLLDSILIDGHEFARMQLNQNTIDTILMNADKGLRTAVLEKLVSDQFIS
jgi:hypothetical protein